MGITMYIVYTRLFARFLLGFILLSTGVDKLAHPRRFQRAIKDYQLLPSVLESKVALSMILSLCIPLAELLAAPGLISGFLLVPATVLTLSLLTLFSGALLVNLARGRRDLSCHCAGAIGSHAISWWLVGRNGLLMAGLLVLLLTPADMCTFDRFARSPSALSTVLFNTLLPVALLVGVVLATLLLVNYARVLWRP